MSPPDPVMCQAWLILGNMNPREAFSKVEVPTADVILVRNNSTLGTIFLETGWDGLLPPGKRDTLFFFKNTGNQEIFSPPCNERFFLDFMIQNADGETKTGHAYFHVCILITPTNASISPLPTILPILIRFYSFFD